MIFTLIIAIAAGFAVRYVEPMVREALKAITLMDLAVSDGKYDMMTLLLMQMVAVIVCVLLSVPTPGFLIVLGSLAGVFGKEMYEAARKGIRADED